MRKRVLLFVVLGLLLIQMGVAADRPSQPVEFTIRGYTTNLIRIPGPPYLVPAESRVLPDGRIQFHLEARGGPESAADDGLCLALYGAPCQALCGSVGGACGASGALSGAFSFDEWGVIDLATGEGRNHGRMTVQTKQGTVVVNFGGQMEGPGVRGRFVVVGGTQKYKKAVVGEYAGDSLYVFSVDYRGVLR